MNQVKLTFESASALAGALTRLTELSANEIINPKDEAEKKGLEQFLSNNVPQHLNELLACWFAVRNEYEPLINGFVGLISRSNAIITKNNKIPAASEESK